MKFYSIFIIALLAFVLSSTLPKAAWAKPKDTSETQAAGPDCPVKKDGDYREALRRRVEKMLIWEVAEEMELPEDKENSMIEIIRDHFKEKTAVIKEEAQLMKDIQSSVDDKKKTSDPELKIKLSKLEEAKAKHAELDKSLNEKMKKVLTVEQQAKFAVVWPRVQEDIKTFLEKKRQERKMKEGSGGPGKDKGKIPGKGKDKDNWKNKQIPTETEN